MPRSTLNDKLRRYKIDPNELVRGKPKKKDEDDDE